MLPEWHDEVVKFGFWDRLFFLFTGEVKVEIYVHEGKVENVCVGISGDYTCHMMENYEQK